MEHIGESLSEKEKKESNTEQGVKCEHLNLEIIETGQKRCKDCGHGMPGRKPGGRNQATIERDAAKKLFEDRILSNLQELLASQFKLAHGASFVYRIETNPKTGTKTHILVEDPEEIRQFLDEYQGSNGEIEGEYYYITTRAPENRALDSLIDRVLGKAPQEVKHSGTIGIITGMKVIKDNGDRIPNKEPEATPSS